MPSNRKPKTAAKKTVDTSNEFTGKAAHDSKGKPLAGVKTLTIRFNDAEYEQLLEVKDALGSSTLSKAIKYLVAKELDNEF